MLQPQFFAHYVAFAVGDTISDLRFRILERVSLTFTPSANTPIASMLQPQFFADYVAFAVGDTISDLRFRILERVSLTFTPSSITQLRQCSNLSSLPLCGILPKALKKEYLKIRVLEILTSHHRQGLRQLPRWPIA
jgi:hypothetical protein